MKRNEFEKQLGEKYLLDPVYWIEHALGVFTWSKMRDIIESVFNNKYTAVRACHGSSKTFTAAALVLWFFNVLRVSKTITTAPTFLQVEALLWTEINQLFNWSKVGLIGECQVVRIKDEKAPNHYVVGFSTDKPARAEGWHAPALLFVLDEAKGIPPWLWNAARGAMTGGFCRMLAISTTDGVSAGEQYYNAFKKPQVAKNWNQIHIDVKDLPSYTGEKFQGRDFVTGKRIYKSFDNMGIQLSTPEWERECIDEWGEDSILYLTKCRGMITDETADSIIKLSQTMAMRKNYENPDYGLDGVKEVGVDVARMGDDHSIFYRKKGLRVLDKRKFSKMRAFQLADELEPFVGFRKNLPEIRIKIDDTGVGGGLTDEMIRRGYKNIIPINFNQRAMEEDKYPNAISEMWFTLAAKIDLIAWGEDDTLQSQLVNRKKLPLDNKGRRRVEPKDDYKKRFQISPDEADAFLLCFYEVDDSSAIIVQSKGEF